MEKNIPLKKFIHNPAVQTNKGPVNFFSKGVELIPYYRMRVHRRDGITKVGFAKIGEFMWIKFADVHFVVGVFAGANWCRNDKLTFGLKDSSYLNEHVVWLLKMFDDVGQYNQVKLCIR